MPLIVDDLIVGGVVGGAALYKYLTARGAANEEEREKAEHAEATKAASETPTVIVLGEQSVGKTCLMKRMCEDTFPEESNPTIGASFLTLKVELEDDKSVEFNVWDTAGQERFKGMNMGYLKGAAAAIIVYDINERGSFSEASWWLQQLQRMCDLDKMPVALVGNKLDNAGEDRKVEQKDVEEVMQEHNNPEVNNMICLELSAKTGENVPELAKQIALKMLAMKEGEETEE